MKELRMGGKARSRAPSSRLSESTQDISHRREIILDALINSDASSIAKFNKIVQEQEEGVAYRKKTDVLNVQAPRVVGNRSGPPVFSPKWDNYDVMKHRWSYIQPQTKRLASPDCHVTPETSDGTVVSLCTSDGSKRSLNGRYSDVEKFGNTITLRASPHR